MFPVRRDPVRGAITTLTLALFAGEVEGGFDVEGVDVTREATEQPKAQRALWSELPRSPLAPRRARLASGPPQVGVCPAELAAALNDPARTLFLDVETTGLSHYYDDITLVGFEIGGFHRVHIVGDNPSDLRDALAGAAVLVTFNGKQFDVPFLRKSFEGLRFPDRHLDLRYACRRAGLSGGQKAIETHLGLRLRGSDEIADGASAVLLWHRYVRGDLAALRELISYNKADVLGMMGIVDHLAEAFGMGEDLLGPRASFLSRAIVDLGSAAQGASLPSPSRVRRRAPRFGDVFRRARNTRVVGIDLTGSELKPSGFAVLDGAVARTAMIASDDDLVAAVLAAAPALVSIDSPLSLPRGRTRVDDGDPGRTKFGIMRTSERMLKRRGINVYPCLLPSMQKLTARGITLAERLRAVGIPVIESYPGAAQDIMGIPRKGAGEKWLRLGLEEFGLDGPFKTSTVTHDELDAITSALVGTFFLEGRYESLTGAEENALIVPDLDASRQGLVIGLSGRISAGKTTAARILEARGFAYVRFSMVIDDVILSRGLVPDRVSRQAVGFEIHETKGQRWLCERVAERLGDSPYAVIDGLRWPEDRAFLAERYDGRFLHVHLDADACVRESRYELEGGAGRTFAEADVQEVERSIDDVRNLAAIKIVNESTLEALEEQLVALVRDGPGSLGRVCQSR